MQGAAQVRARIKDAVTVFILPPSYEVLEPRLRGRGQDDEATIRRRLAAAGREIDAFEEYDFVIVNDDLDACVEELESIVRAARCRVAVRERARARDREDVSVRTRRSERRHDQMILPKDVDSKFRFITVAAQRAKQLQAGAKPRVETRSRKSTRIAIEETLAGTDLVGDPRGAGARRSARTRPRRSSVRCRSSSSASPGASAPTRPARSCASCSGARSTCAW